MWTSTWVHSSAQLEASSAGGITVLGCSRSLLSRDWLAEVEAGSWIKRSGETGQKLLRKGSFLNSSKGMSKYNMDTSKD